MVVVRIVEMTGPGDLEFASSARMTAVAIAGAAGLSSDGCEELRIAVEESCVALICAGADRLHLVFSTGDDISVSVCAGEPVDLRLTTTSELVLTSLSDSLLVVRHPGAIIVTKLLG